MAKTISWDLMKRSSEQSIFGGIAQSEFVGRGRELERLLQHARGSSGLALLATPNCGSSELLKQLFDRLFAEQEEIIPFYFAVKRGDGSALRTARRFLREFLVQTVAFRRRNAFLLDASPDINEIAELAVPSDGLWIDRLIETAGEYGNDDETSRLRTYLSSPLRALANGANVFMIVDDLHETAHLSDGDSFMLTLADVFGQYGLPFVLAGHRRFMYGRTPLETMQLGRLSFTDAGMLAQSLAAKYDVPINDQTRDLIAVQFQGNAPYMSSFFATAAERRVGVESFQTFETIYADEIFGGRISRQIDDLFDVVDPDTVSQNHLIGNISDLLTG